MKKLATYYKSEKQLLLRAVVDIIEYTILLFALIGFIEFVRAIMVALIW